MKLNLAFLKNIQFPRVLLVTLTGILVGVWLYFTPDGLLGKADAIGYSVCHQIGSHSFFLTGRRLPLCARCTGMHLGAFWGLAYQYWRGKKRGGMPPIKIALVLGIFLIAFAVDGTNSYLHFFPGFEGLYQPQNWLRLLTGTTLGLGIAAVLFPVFNQTVWREWENLPAMGGWRDLGILLAGVALIDLAVLSLNPFFLYPLALLSGFDVLIVLGLIYSIVWAMITKRENKHDSWKTLWPLLLAGFATALLQVGIMDVVRFLLTGTWSGFNL
jgi:uncharacterized membrane protein